MALIQLSSCNGLRKGSYKILPGWYPTSRPKRVFSLTFAFGTLELVRLLETVCIRKLLVAMVECPKMVPWGSCFPIVINSTEHRKAHSPGDRSSSGTLHTGNLTYGPTLYGFVHLLR